MILFISTNDNLIEELTTTLPATFSVVRLAMASEVQPYLASQANDDRTPALIFLDASPGQDVVLACQQLRQITGPNNVPIIAIIATPADRQAVLEAGAADYLLLPLSSAEVKARLVIHLPAALGGFNTLMEARHKTSYGTASSTRILNQGVKNIAKIFNASLAWLFLLDPEKEDALLAGSYNLPALLHQESSILVDEARIRLKIFRQRPSNLPQIMPVPLYPRASFRDINEFTHYLSVPLRNGQNLIGLLNLAYPEIPKFSQIEERMLIRMAQDMAALLEIFRLQNETQVHATQTAFMVLIARLVSERLDLNLSLSLTLEQAVTLLNASGGEIWLLSTDGQWFELASSLTSPFSNPQLTRRAKGQGLIGWVAAQGKALHTHTPADDPRFDPQVDQIDGGAAYSLLAMPLLHQEIIIGVLAIHNKHGIPFVNRDAVLLEGIASLTASAIANARLMQELRDYASQQRILYEMSQQIAAGLELQTTLNLALHWVGYLSDVEVSLLWLIETVQKKDMLCLVGAVGVELAQEAAIMVALEQDLAGWVAHHNQAVMVNNPADDPRLDFSITHRLNIKLHNIIAVPMTYYGEIIGVISLLNKRGTPFTQEDLTLTSTAVEMIAVAVGNARLHTQTLALMEQRERLHQQAIQAERLATIGRLTASLSHEINNPMQAIRGALTLAMEELNNPQELATYIQMSLQESERVVHLVNRMRQIYRPQTDIPEKLAVNHVLQEAIDIARKELVRQQVTLQADLAANLPPIRGIVNQLYLVFLNLILNLSDAIGTAGGGELQLRSHILSEAVRIEFSTNVSLATGADWINVFDPDTLQTEEGASFDLSLSHDIIVAHGGAIRLSRQDQQTTFSIELPLSTDNE